MQMNDSQRIPASKQQVWAALNDPAVLKECIPGCQSLEKLSDERMKATATVKVGPVKARWKGKVTLSDLDPPNGYKISGEGEGGVAAGGRSGDGQGDRRFPEDRPRSGGAGADQDAGSRRRHL